MIKNAPFNAVNTRFLLQYRSAPVGGGRIELYLRVNTLLPTFQAMRGDFKDETFGVVRGKTINVALVGNPNSGKDHPLQRVVGSPEKVGNYCG